MTLLFNDKTLPFIMAALELTTTPNGYVIDKHKQFEHDVDGNKFKPEQLIGIYKQKYITEERQLLSFVSIQLNNSTF